MKRVQYAFSSARVIIASHRRAFGRCYVHLSRARTHPLPVRRQNQKKQRQKQTAFHALIDLCKPRQVQQNSHSSPEQTKSTINQRGSSLFSVGELSRGG